MRTMKASAMAWGLALLLGSTASAQTNSAQTKDGNPGGGGADKSQAQGQSNAQSKGQTETIRGELASVSVIGETMVDNNSGRGIMAELTYLTILGSPSGTDRMGEAGGSGADRQQGRSGSEGSNRQSGNAQAGAGQEGSRGQGGGEWSRRRVYQIAVGPDTQVEDRSSHQGQGQGNQQGQNQGGQQGQGQGGQQGTSGRSALGRTQAALAALELGDRVRVEFERMTPQGNQANAGNAGNDAQSGSGNRMKHGRHRIIRGVARKITILSTPEERQQAEKEQGSHDQGSGSGNNSGSGSGKSKD